MELDRSLCVGIDDEYHKKCIEKAENFDPCLIEFSSDSSAIVDIYIKNVTSTRFYLEKSDVEVFSGPVIIPKPGIWVVPPSKVIKRGETAFMRAYSGKVDNTNPSICAIPAEMRVKVAYKSCVAVVSLSVFTTREPKGDGCKGLQPFTPVQVAEFGASPGGVLNMLYLQPSSEDERWRNTAYFLIS